MNYQANLIPSSPQQHYAISAALPHYDLSGSKVEFIRQSFNTVFRVEGKDGNPYAFRLHRFNARGVAEMRSEFIWLEALRRAGGVLAAEPVTNNYGDFITEVLALEGSEPQYCTVLRWHPGSTLTVGAPDEHYMMMGELMARLHHHASDYMPAPGFVRPRRDRDYPRECVESIRRSSARLPGEVLLALDAVADRIEQTMVMIGESPEDFGLIHGDLHGENVLFHDGTIRAIDFDGCVWGYYLYDLAVALFHLPRGRVLPFLQGYRSHRDWSPSRWRAVESFYALRILDQLAYHFSTEQAHVYGLSLLRKAVPMLVDRYLEGLPFLQGVPGVSPSSRRARPVRRGRSGRTGKLRLVSDSSV
jgi:Ser/Thr protein kinase RdoA (MazF antagonist)